MNENKIDITVIMPALNEEKNIASAINNTLRAFDNLNVRGEIVAVNDGSTDRTEDLVYDAIKRDSRIRMIKHKVPKGIGATFWEGVDNANGGIVVLLPGDDENYPMEILRYHRLLEHVDIVIPFIFNREARNLFRNALSLIYRFIINSTFVINLNYTNGTVLYRKSVLREMNYRSRGFFFQTDILVRLIKKGYLFAEVPSRIKTRKEGASKALSFPSFLQVVSGYLHLVRDYYFIIDKNIEPQFLDDSLTIIRRHEDPTD